MGTCSPKLGFILVFLHISIVVNGKSVMPSGSNSGLCSRELKTLSCSPQLSSELLPSSCEVAIILKNETVCQNWFDSAPTCGRLSSCGVSIQPFTYIDVDSPYNFTQIAFNISFTEPAKEMIVRIERLDSRDFRFCRQFRLDEVALSFDDSHVWFDCLFHDQTYASMELALDFKVDDQLGRFIFTVPQDSHQGAETDFTNWEIFIYLHVTSLPRPVVTFQKVPSEFKKDFFKIQLIRCDLSLKETLKTIIVDVKNPNTFAYMHQDMVTVDIGVDLAGGNYTVEIEVDDPRMRGKVSSTPFFLIVGETLPIFLIICIASIALVLFVIVLFVISWKLALASKKGLLLAQDVKSIVFLYDPVSAAHVKVVVALKNYLEEHYSLRVMLDIHDISQTKHKDPFEWYSTAIADADCVAIIVSPSVKTPKELATNVDYSTLRAQTLKKRGDNNEIIYQFTYSLGISLLTSRIHGMMKEKKFNLESFVVLIPPYASEKNIPSAGLNFRRFRIPEQMNAFLKHVQHCTNCANLERPNVECCISSRRSFSNGIELSQFGNSLESAIKSASSVQYTEPLLVEESPLPVNEETSLVESKVVADVENILECSSSEDDIAQHRYSPSEFGLFPPGVRELPTLFSTE